MRTLILQKVMRCIVVAATAVMTIMMVAPANAASLVAATGARLCLPIYLTGIGGPGEPDPVLIKTQADVFLGRYKVASTAASFTPGGVVGNSLAFTGPIVFTPRSGTATLTANVSGNVNVVTGQFEATSFSVPGTGAITGITGSLAFRGDQNLATGAFTETITGVLCSSVRPW